MANDYLVTKWRNWFGFFNHYQDGKMCYADMETARNKFISLHHLEGEKKQNMFDIITKWWAEYVMWGKQEITVDEFIGKQNAAFKADKKAFIARMHKCQEIINGYISLTEEGFVTEQDILIIVKAVGLEDEERNKKFAHYGYKKVNKVTVNQNVELWKHFLISEDSSIPDPCHEALAEYIS